MSQETGHASNGQRAATIAGLLGVTGALILGAVRLSGQEAPLLREHLAGNLVFVLIMVSPYLLAVAIARTTNSAARGSLLMTLGVLSLAAPFLLVSPLALLLLPATAALVVAAVRSPQGADRQMIWAPLVLIPGLLGVAAIGFGLYALFQVQADEPRCWMLTTMEGRDEWQAMEVPPRTETGGMTMGPFGPEVKKAICTSDIITDQEAALGLAGLGAGVLTVIGTSRLGSSGRPLGEQHW